MNKTTLAALAIALPLSIGNALATPFTHNYSSWEGAISDSKALTWYDSFSLDGLNLTSDSVLTLTFTYSGTGGEKKNSESWSAYADNYLSRLGFIYWSADSIPAASTPLGTSNTASIVFSSTENIDTFNSILSHQSVHQALVFAFSETTDKTDRFNLSSASLTVTKAVVPTPSAPIPEPETYALFAAGLTLLGAISRRRKNDTA